MKEAHKVLWRVFDKLFTDFRDCFSGADYHDALSTAKSRFQPVPSTWLGHQRTFVALVVHFALPWIKVAIHFPKGKVWCQRAAIPVDDSCTYSILTTSRTLNCCLSGNTPVFCEFLKLLLYKSPFAQLLQCIFTLSAPASFCICSLGLKQLVLFFHNSCQLVNNLVCC